MNQIPILFYSDSPALPTGLARITKDLATQVAGLPEFRVATFGRGGIYSSKLPFPQYNFDVGHQWGEEYIEEVWEDFSRGEKGVIFTIWDLTRLDWFARPRMKDENLKRFLTSGKFKKWGYIPVDSYSVGGGLTGMSVDTLMGFDRRLAYSIFGKDVIETSIGLETDWIPHGFNQKVFQPRDRVASRMAVGVKDEVTMIGCVMTNQARKDWGTAFAAIARLKNKIPNLKFWVHVDDCFRYWNIPALIDDFRLNDAVIQTFSGDYSSEQLSYCYSASDITILPSLGEGFGFPIVESMACGVPCLHTNYGGGVELLPDKSWAVPHSVDRLDGPSTSVRPVLSPETWSNTMHDVIEESRGEALKDMCIGAVDHLQWKNLWPTWKKWFLDGLQK